MKSGIGVSRWFCNNSRLALPHLSLHSAMFLISHHRGLSWNHYHKRCSTFNLHPSNTVPFLPAGPDHSFGTCKKARWQFHFLLAVYLFNSLIPAYSTPSCCDIPPGSSTFQEVGGYTHANRTETHSTVQDILITQFTWFQINANMTRRNNLIRDYSWGAG